MARTLSYQVGILTFGRMAAYMALFFVPLVNVRTLSQYDYGVYRQFWLLFESLSAIFIMSFPNSLFYYLPRSETEKEKSIYVTQTLVFLIVMGLLSWGAYGILNVVLHEGLGAVVEQYFWAFCFFTFFMIVSRYMDSLFVAEKQAERQTVYHMSTNILQAMLVISLSWFTRDITFMVWGLTGFAFLKFLFTLFYTKAVYGIQLRFISMNSIKEQFSYALPLGLSSIVLILFTQTDKYIITHYLGSSAFAIYSVGAFQVPFVNIIRGSVTNITFPLMADMQKQGNYEEIVDLYQRATLKTAVLFYPIFAFLAVSAREFITILFTHQYAEAAPVFMLYLLLFVRSSVETGSILMIFKKNIFLFEVFLVGFVVNVFLSIILFKQFGRLGVPAATVIVTYAVNIVNILRASRLLKVSFFRILPWGKMGVRLIVAVVPAVIPWLFYSNLYIDSFKSIAGIGAIYFAVYALLSFKLGFIRWDDIKSIFGRTSRVA